MRTKYFQAVAALVVAGLILVEPGVGRAANGSPEEYLVVVNGDRAVDVVADHLENDDADVTHELKGALDLVVATLDAEQLADISDRPGVRWVEPNRVIKLASEQDIAQSQFTSNWGLDRIDQTSSTLDRKFRYGNDGTGVDIYVIDTGIRRTHTEFTGRVAAGYVVPSVGSTTDDDCGHGTHVAGIAAGTTYGVAKKATIVPIKIFPGGSVTICKGGTTVDAFVAGINWILANKTAGKPAVANLSLGLDVASTTLDTSVRNLAAVMPVIVAAGNDGTSTGNEGYVALGSNSTAKSPACTSRKPDPDRNNQLTPSILTVGATGGISNNAFTREDDEARYSNHGPCVDIFAPGTNIKSAWPATFDSDGDGINDAGANDFAGRYSDTATYNNSGTSMATPFVAGAAALLLQTLKTASPAEITSQILATATKDAVTLMPRVGSPNASPRLLLYTCTSNCPPSAPKDVTVARAGRTDITVTWKAPDTDGGSAVTSYTATAAAGTGTPITCTVNALTCTLSGLIAGTSYSITVAATNSMGAGASSTAKTLSAGALSTAPGAPTVKVGSAVAEATWTAPTDNGGLTISKYTVTVTPGGATCSPKTGELTCVVAGLTNGTKYSFAVTATNDAGDSPASAATTATPAFPWKYVPAFVSVVPGNKKVDLEWSEALVDGAAAAGYFTGYVVRDASGAVVCTTTELECTVSNLVNAAKASFTVAATTIADTSEVAMSTEVLVGGLRQVANAMRRKTTASLVRVATTNSTGKVTWKALSGGCRVTKATVTAPAAGKSCKLRISVAKSGAFPAESLTVTLQLL